MHLFTAKYLKEDFASSIVVFLVAMPLCLGIALASGAPLFSGIISGIIGGIVVGIFSGSEKSVSGPAAGLSVIVLQSIESLGSFEIFLLAVLLSGIFQIALSALKAGFIAGLFPNSVIKGMLAAIGLVIILKQIPHALGRDTDYEGEYEFFQIADGENTFSEILRAVETMSWSALLITLLSLTIILFWNNVISKKIPSLSKIPGALFAVIIGAVVNQLLLRYSPDLALIEEDGHLVKVPFLNNASQIKNAIITPAWEAIDNIEVYITAFTIAIVGSLETLLNVEATDRIDPEKKIADANKELKAQGIGNIVAALIGGLPITSVIVRSSANVYSGARTRLSSIFHGLILLISILFISKWLNLIPLASLAAILFVVGYKLVNPKIFIDMYSKGRDQFLPFIVTVLAIVFTDLLYGILIGLTIGIIFVMIRNYQSALTVVSDGKYILFRFNKDVSFMNKPKLKTELSKIPNDTYVILDAHKAQFIDNDIIDIIEDFEESKVDRNITTELIHIDIRKQK